MPSRSLALAFPCHTPPPSKQMLSFLHDFLASKCLETEYLAMFGTGLGAVRNNTIIPWTEDVDVGITPLALQFLELNSTREELWRHGYSLWHHLCEYMVRSRVWVLVVEI